MMSLADTDVEDHDDTGLGDDYNDEMIDEEDDDFHENRVIEVRWREALDGLDYLLVLGQPAASSDLIHVATEPFEAVNVDDLFDLRRPLGFDCQCQSGRSSVEQPVTEVNGFQHPLLSRPSQSGDLVSMWSSGMDSLHTQGRSGPGDGRWTDDGQPQTGAQAAAIAHNRGIVPVAAV